jgi:hypothetical protein
LGFAEREKSELKERMDEILRDQTQMNTVRENRRDYETQKLTSEITLKEHDL